MPALKPTSHTARVTWLGLVPGGEGLPSQAVQQMQLDFGGPVGERHSGLTRPSCSRVTALYPRGTDIANVRQLSIVSEEEMERIARTMGLARLAPEWLGASMVVKGIADFTLLPPSSRLQAADGAVLVIDMANRPCHLPAREIEARHPGAGKRFKAAARNLRGVTAWVERPGNLTLGDALRLHVPDQPPWPGSEAVRA